MITIYSKKKNFKIKRDNLSVISFKKIRLPQLSCSLALNGNSAFCLRVFNTLPKVLQPLLVRARTQIGVLIAGTLTKKRTTFWLSLLKIRLPRFERGTLCLEGRCSIQLSYRRINFYSVCINRISHQTFFARVLF